ncbi:protein-tyrosine-phosphatase [Planctomycetaceae bacterium SH139]
MTAKQPASSVELLYPDLLRYLGERMSAFELISEDRKLALGKIADYIRDRVAKSEPAKLTFICTHNSRRSHLSQIWARVAADYYGLDGVETFSGGTEATAFNPRAVAAMQRCGLRITADDVAATNPRYAVSAAPASTPQICFSKVYDAPPNPNSDYCAVMTCSQADETCPLVMGCDLRTPIRYEDPKVADDSDLESQRYDERAAQICSEMLYLMSRV